MAHPMTHAEYPRARRSTGRKILWGILAVLMVVALGLAFLAFKPVPLPDVSAAQARLPKGQALIDRGRHLTEVADCVACHTGPSGLRYAGGYPMKLPFATLYTPNITPDETYGIGKYTDAEFVRAVKQGVNRHGVNLYPAFSYTSYALMRDEDVLAIKAYLFSLPPVRYQPPETRLPFPFNQRYGLKLWNMMFLPDQPWKDDPQKTPRQNYGGYLVNALAHCGECHTPRNLMMAMETSSPLSGSKVAGAYNITPHKDYGVGWWSDADLAQYLATGHAPGHGTAALGMAEAVDNSLRKLPREDIDAIVAYLRSIPAIEGNWKVKVNANPPALAQATLSLPGPDNGDAQIKLGRRVFAGSCAGCHAWNGEGRSTPFAALRGARSVNDPEGHNLLQLVFAGSKLTAPNGQMLTMPAFKHKTALTDTEVAAVSAFVVHHFGGQEPKITTENAKHARP